jgi:hypothetical protein
MTKLMLMGIDPTDEFHGIDRLDPYCARAANAYIYVANFSGASLP